MKKRVAKKILKNKELLKYSERQIEQAQSVLDLVEDAPEKQKPAKTREE